ncbi:MAG: polyprenyl synthetase family protein [Oscillospiraceae bacterium]|nr:polyprenyl synthetase family protein [Oscillospiraceae bacterium]
MEHKAEYERVRRLVEAELECCLTGEYPQRELLDAMRYSLLAGGKRIRPVLVLKFCEAMCGSVEPALDYACAVEMLHTYSLIHDDLPCMDNDDLRRGKPTCHKAFGERNAVLAGDALQAEAFYRLASSKRPARAVSNGQACAVLGEAAGAVAGICAGQYLDLEGEGKPKTLEELTLIHTWKTAALLKAACLLGLVASPVEATAEQWRGAGIYAQELGMAFQIRDDMLDQESTTEELGQPVGSDAENGKETFATLYGLERCRELVEEHTRRAKEAIRGLFPDTDFLCWLADALAQRKS